MTLAHYPPNQYQQPTGQVTAYQPQAPTPTSQVVALAEWAQAAQAAYQVAESLVETSFVPEAFRRKPYEATAAILAGSEVGLSPMAALRAFDVIQGTAAPRAMTLRAIVQSCGHEVWIEEATDNRAIVCGRRNGSTREQKSVWTIDRARGLGLTSKHNWKNQPKAMLIARATAEVCRLIASDAILGLPYSVEEIDDGAMPADQPVPAAEPGRSTEQAVPVPRRTAKRRETPKPAPTPPAAEPAPEDSGPPLPGEDGYDDEGQAELPVEAPQDAAEEKSTAAQNRKMHALFAEADITERDDRLRLSSILLGRELDTSAGLTKHDANKVIDHLEQWAKDGHLADHAAAVLHGGEGK